MSARRGDRHMLVVLLNGIRVGNIHQTHAGILRFSYEDAWRNSETAYPLSLSMPLAAPEHRHEVISAFLWGLLPDNDRTLDHYARLFGVSARNPVALLSYMGADCAGAVQFVPPESADDVQSASLQDDAVEWIDELDIARELQAVRRYGVPGTSQRIAGQFSLAGAQPKIALLEENGRWGRPSGRMPTNRILKPPSGEFRGFAENEHVCLEIARELGLGVVGSRVMTFGDEVAIVVDRFDRAQIDGQYTRIHQEDICQALGVMPTRKYEREGGPGIAAVVSLIRDTSLESQQDLERFIQATVLNWVIAATDAHAKNYALLHSAGGGVRLAPFYDVLSYLPYTDAALHKVKLAMKIGGTYLVRRVSEASWEALAKATGLPFASIVESLTHVLSRFPDVANKVAERSTRAGLDPSIIEPLRDRMSSRATNCMALFANSRSKTAESPIAAI